MPVPVGLVEAERVPRGVAGGGHGRGAHERGVEHGEAGDGEGLRGLVLVLVLVLVRVGVGGGRRRAHARL
jgi:hypothetical protein